MPLAISFTGFLFHPIKQLSHYGLRPCRSVPSPCLSDLIHFCSLPYFFWPRHSSLLALSLNHPGKPLPEGVCTCYYGCLEFLVPYLCRAGSPGLCANVSPLIRLFCSSEITSGISGVSCFVIHLGEQEHLRKLSC